MATLHHATPPRADGERHHQSQILWLILAVATLGLIFVWPTSKPDAVYWIYGLAACVFAGTAGVCLGHLVGRIDNEWRLKHRFWLGWICAAIAISVVWFTVVPLDSPWAADEVRMAVTILLICLMAAWLEVTAFMVTLPQYVARERKRRMSQLRTLRERIAALAPDHVFPENAPLTIEQSTPRMGIWILSLTAAWCLIGLGLTALLYARPTALQGARYDGFTFEGKKGYYETIDVDQPSVAAIKVKLPGQLPVPIGGLSEAVVAEHFHKRPVRITLSEVMGADNSQERPGSTYVGQHVEFRFDAAGVLEFAKFIGTDPREPVAEFSIADGESEQLLELPIAYERVHQVFGRPQSLARSYYQ